MSNKFVIFTDGSSRGNPGPGGYGAIIYDEKEKQVTEIGGYEKDTTNNRMELRAAIESLLALRKMTSHEEEARETLIHTDSAYVINGITKWVKKWENNNWMTGQKEGVLNQDLWQALLELSRDRDIKGGIQWKKVSGHAGVPANERGDEIATSFADGKSILLFSGTIEDYEKMLGAPILTVSPQKTKKKSPSKRVKGEAYSYVSFVDGKIHVDKTWPACEKRVKGTKGAKYKKAMNKEEENDLIALYSFDSLV
jgi:ribonuclease HI